MVFFAWLVSTITDRWYLFEFIFAFVLVLKIRFMSCVVCKTTGKCIYIYIFLSIFDPQYLQDVDEEVAEMTKKKQRECEVSLIYLSVFM